jgi:hypothetical protein
MGGGAVQPRGEGRRRKIKLKATYIWQMANGVGKYLLFFLLFFMVFLCVSQQGEFKNTIKNVLEKIHVKNFWPKTLRDFCFFPFVFSRRFFIAFLAVSLHEELENTTKLFGENPKKLREKKLFSFRLFPSICFIAFLAVSLHKEPKNTIKMFFKIGPENLKKSQKR